MLFGALLGDGVQRARVHHTYSIAITRNASFFIQIKFNRVKTTTTTTVPLFFLAETAAAVVWLAVLETSCSRLETSRRASEKASQTTFVCRYRIEMAATYADGW